MAEHHKVEAELELADRATGPLAKIGAAVERISEKFNHASHIVGSFASVAAVVGGAFSIHEAIDKTREHLAAVQRISTITGLAVNRADGLAEAFSTAGVEMGEAERIMLMLSKRGASMEMSMARATGQVSPMAEQFKRLGINVKEGPEANLLRMSELAQKGKIGVDQLMTTFGVRGQMAVSFMRLLQKGPHHLREAVEEAKKFGVTLEDMSNFRRMTAASNRIRATWDRILIIVGTKLLPFLADMLEGGAVKLKGWLEHAQKFGETMSYWLKQHYQTVLSITKLLLLNFTLQKVTGKAMPEYGKKLFEWAFPGGKFMNAAPVRGAAARGMIENGKRVYNVGGTEGGGGIGGVAATLVGRLQPLFAGLGRLTLVGAAVAFVLTAFRMIKDDVNGIRTYFVKFWDTLMNRFQAFADLFSNIFDSSGGGIMGRMMGAIKSFMEGWVSTVLKALPEYVDHVLGAIHLTINLVRTMVNNPRALLDPKQLYAEAAMRTQMQMANAAAERQRRKDLELMDTKFKPAEPETPNVRDRNYFDFRNSRFDIKQAFAEGFDPDRVAVAFVNDLASIGERKLQSGFSPLFSIR